jgi:hypothetical protein
MIVNVSTRSHQSKSIIRTRAKSINLRCDLLDDIQETACCSSITADFAKRAKRTAEFAAAKNIDARSLGWREKPDDFSRCLVLAGQADPKKDSRAARCGCGIAKRNVSGLRSTGSEADTESLYSQVMVFTAGTRTAKTREDVQYRRARAVTIVAVLTNDG